MSCPPECERTGMCIRACVAHTGPVCIPCQEGDCSRCKKEAWDEETDEALPCACTCEGAWDVTHPRLT